MVQALGELLTTVAASGVPAAPETPPPPAAEDRQEWHVTRLADGGRCQSFGCWRQAVYLVQRTSAEPTRRTRALCHPHAKSWAAIHGAAWPFGDHEAPPPGHQAYMVPGRYGDDFCCERHETEFERRAQPWSPHPQTAPISPQAWRYIHERLG
jgi:hypothetical protein